MPALPVVATASRRLALAVLSLTLLAVVSLGGESVFAQEAAPAAAEAPAAAPAAAEPAPVEEQSFLMWMIEASGLFGFFIMLVSFVMVALIMMILLQLRRGNYLPPDLVEQFEQKLNSKDYQGAYELARANDSFLGRVLAAGMGRLSRGFDEAQAGMQEVGDDETMAMEHKIGYLALIGSIAPMLGLLGTIQGMVMSFRVIALSPTTPKPNELADGISTALFTTLEGLVVAIPAIVFYAVFKNRLQRFVMECSFVADGLMGRFQTAGKTASRPAAGAAPATAAE
ncbi:MAG: MotA/TolQ/ExbB proton channel family protein [Planctomycetaceae bacterium]|nr:MotA/TolQ/ExbB proton channel family protein [Planctomycetaceae bacterium]